MTIPWLDVSDPFPPVELALDEPNGLLAAGGDLSPARLLAAYTRGIFPWFSEDEPLLWWSPDPRMILPVDELRVSRSLRRRIRSGVYRMTLDTAFVQVMSACGYIRRDQGTWITPSMIEGYEALHRLGYAHSVEAWQGAELAGGLYGVAIGRMFYGESMFARATDASKVALAHLVRQLAAWGFELIDCQMSTTHLASLGGREVSRREFLDRVRELTARPAVPSPWQFDPGIAESF